MPLTEIYRDLNLYQLLLGKPLHALLRKRADLAMRTGTLALGQPISEQEWDERVEGGGWRVQRLS
jgi:hypothetical protein